MNDTNAQNLELDTRHLEPSIHPAYARLLAAHLKRQGISMEELFSGNSISWEELISKPGFVSFEQFRKLMLRAFTLTGNTHLELEISSIVQASAHGPLGYGALAASSVRDTFRLVEKMLATRLTIIEIESQEQEDCSRYRIYPRFSLGELEVFVYMMLLGSFIDLLEKTTGQSLIEISVCLPFSPLEQLTEYQTKYPGVSFVFNHSCFETTIPVSLLDQPCLTADEFAYRNAIRECEQILSQKGEVGVLARRVKSILLASNGEFPTQERVASQMAMSSRTLIRRLKDEDTSFQSLLDEVRKELVVWFLSETTLSIEQISDKLGYVDTSNFSRVFRRWFHQTPSEFRKQLTPLTRELNGPIIVQ